MDFLINFSRGINIISKLTILASLIFVIVVGYWLTWPYEPIRFINQRTVLLNQNLMVKTGEPLLIEVEVEQYKDGVVYSIDRRLIGRDMVYVLPSTSRTTEKGYHKYVNASFLIPEFIPDGEYKIKTIIKVQVNPLRTIVIERDSETFRVYK